ncbi:MAG: hypothetical protein QXS00_04100 [Pyrobaculum sp.]|uniref:Uncharacterized protein n=1 Tax=Pyrobaculum oguniense (strain DSM 13380 / JCM 10595 / TE7) TaxID=698757 RepID=H6Q825_PYROT|nr:hypothetical protein Pogu_0655 [Pyrobaculum oguniense TE7]
MRKLEGEEDMPVDYGAVWAILKAVFNTVATLLASLGFGEAGGRVAAAVFFASFFFLMGVFRKTRRIVGLLLAATIIILALLAFI